MLDTLASHLDYFAALAPLWGYAFIFAFMAIESSFIPFPSEIVMIPAGFLAARGELTLHAPVPDLALACAVGLAGSLAGAYFNYFLSSKLGEPFLRKYGKWFFVKPEALDRACEVFNRYGGVTTFVCRLIPVIRQLISIPAGLARSSQALARESGRPSSPPSDTRSDAPPAISRTWSSSIAARRCSTRTSSGSSSAPRCWPWPTSPSPSSS